MTAAEVRKRLAQYYQLPEHAAEPVIAYQPGSYVPEFFVPCTPAAADTPAPPVETVEHTTATSACVSGAPRLADPRSLWQSRRDGVSRWPCGRGRDIASPDAVDRFWAPIVKASAPVLLCIGDPFSPRPGPGPGNESTEPRPQRHNDRRVPPVEFGAVYRLGDAGTARGGASGAEQALSHSSACRNGAAGSAGRAGDAHRGIQQSVDAQAWRTASLCAGLGSTMAAIFAIRIIPTTATGMPDESSERPHGDVWSDHARPGPCHRALGRGGIRSRARNARRRRMPASTQDA